MMTKTMRIFGTKGVKSHVSTGTFHCPSCQSTQVYALKQIIDYYSILELPIVPQSRQRQFVECQCCRKAFITRVLDYDPVTKDQAFVEQYREVLTQVLALFVLIDEENSTQKKMVMLSMLKKFSSKPLYMEDLEEILLMTSVDNSAFEKLQLINPSLNRTGRELILKCALSVATIDGLVNEFELVLMTKITECLGLDSQFLIRLLNKHTSMHAA